MITIMMIQHHVAVSFGTPFIDMRSDRRGREVSLARHAAMFLARQLTVSSLPAIGRLFGGRDHTTVMSAINRVRSRMDVDVEFAALLRTITAELETDLEHA